MSRSYKKHPIIKERNRHTKLIKRQASKKVRKIAKNIKANIKDGNFYKKIFDSWIVRDFSLSLYKRKVYIIGINFNTEKKQVDYILYNSINY